MALRLRSDGSAVLTPLSENVLIPQRYHSATHIPNI